MNTGICISQWNRLSASGEYRAVLKKTNIKNEDRQFIEVKSIYCLSISKSIFLILT